jgi:hypothetical protein
VIAGAIDCLIIEPRRFVESCERLGDVTPGWRWHGSCCSATPPSWGWQENDMKRASISTAVMLSMMSVGSVALAGYKSIPFVAVQISDYGNGTPGGRAFGITGAARNSENNVEFIGCSVSKGGLFCSARDAHGLTRYCSTYDKALVVIGAGISDGASVEFFYDGDGNCRDVDISKYSYDEPKVK